MRVAMVIEQCWQPVPGGSGTYIAELTRAMPSGTEVVGVRALHRSQTRPAPDVAPTVGVERAAPLPRRALYDAWSRLHAPRVEWLTGRVDVVHAPTWAIPATARPLAVTVHDLAFVRSPEHFTARGVRFFEGAWRRTLEQARLVVVPSQHTLDDCVDAGLDPARAIVVPHGVQVPDVAEREIADFRARHGLHRPYVLWCGTVEPRKNVAGVVEGFLAADLSPDVELVLAGPSGWGDERVAGLDSPRVRRTGRLSGADLHRAYAGAAAFCFPSWWEGFGLPVLEAMAHGVPVVTSKDTSMAEFAQGAGALVDPADRDDIARGLEQALGPRGADWGRTGMAHARRMTWTRAANAHVAAFASLT